MCSEGQSYTEAMSQVTGELRHSNAGFASGTEEREFLVPDLGFYPVTVGKLSGFFKPQGYY